MTAADGNLTAALGWTALGGSVVDHGLQERRNTASVTSAHCTEQCDTGRVLLAGILSILTAAVYRVSTFCTPKSPRAWVKVVNGDGFPICCHALNAVLG